MAHSTAGKGDPYWYEWTVGLHKVVEMLHPESNIKSVSFQVTGAKGWDDVIVRYAKHIREYIQVKHSRAGRNITFGDLVAVEENSSSLLNTLFTCWKTMRLKPETDKCILFTNRQAGQSVGQSRNGITRPPLFDFYRWLNHQMSHVKSFDQIKPPKNWAGAWNEWREQLVPGSPQQKLAFLKCFQVKANQEDLVALERSVIASLAELFQITEPKALPLFHALDNALRRWTTNEYTVTAEDAYAAMSLSSEPESDHRAPPPPSPFLSSRQADLRKLEDVLQRDGPKVIFLSAEPGAGKTSLISQLANRRSPVALHGTVGLRYFAFRPITPDSPLIPPDADYFVRADRLWFNLLSQLRIGLVGKLRNNKVPLRNDLFSWSDARANVLRIASVLGRELKRPFVIAVDGIDHAARAARYESIQAKEFFASLPTPEELVKLPVRFLLAGQPAVSYQEYPTWLRNPDGRIQLVGIGTLNSEDIRLLLRHTNCPIADENGAVETLKAATNGNTLAVVFGVQEARTCKTVADLQKRIASRSLHDGLQEYYRAIWKHALDSITSLPVGAEICLASALCLTPERLSGRLMASAFGRLGLTVEQWQILLSSLGPLIVEEKNGFRMLHNDVRMFLHGFLASVAPAARREGASALANHYLGASSTRWFAHKSLRRLLHEAGRDEEFARVFNVNWVFEAASLKITYPEIADDCAEALRQGVRLKDWDVMQDLACATETLERWEDKCESDRASGLSNVRDAEVLPRETESFVPPLSEWTVADIHKLLEDVELLLNQKELPRARGVVERWLTGLSVVDLCHSVSGLVTSDTRQNGGELELAMGEHITLSRLGAACRSVNVKLKIAKPKEPVERNACVHFEEGWIRASCEQGPFGSLAECFGKHDLQYFGNYERALRSLATKQNMLLVRELLWQLRGSVERLSSRFRMQAVLWALQSKASDDYPRWLEILSVLDSGLKDFRSEDFGTLIILSKALGWQNTAADPLFLAQRVFDALKVEPRRNDGYSHYTLLFRAAATLGQIESVLSRRDGDFAAPMFPPSQLNKIVGALWQFPFQSISSHQDRHYAGDLAKELVNAVFKLGTPHVQALMQSARPVWEKCPIDFRRESLWNLLYRSGNIPQLRAWLRQWLADDGWLWNDEAGSRESIASDLLPLARQLGETDLVNQVEERLNWLQITYRGHKEYAFENPITWFRELRKTDSKSWRSDGLRLWTLSEAARALGADDRSSWFLGEEIGCAAWSAGADDLWQLLTTYYPACGSDSWFRPTANRIIAGLVERLNVSPALPFGERIAGWCLAVGFCRWFNSEDTKSLFRLQEALIASCKTITEQIGMSAALRALTPGECLRKPRPETSEAVGDFAKHDSDLNGWLERIQRGEEIHPEIARRVYRECNFATSRRI